MSNAVRADAGGEATLDLLKTAVREAITEQVQLVLGILREDRAWLQVQLWTLQQLLEVPEQHSPSSSSRQGGRVSGSESPSCAVPSGHAHNRAARLSRDSPRKVTFNIDAADAMPPGSMDVHMLGADMPSGEAPMLELEELDAEASRVEVREAPRARPPKHEPHRRDASGDGAGCDVSASLSRQTSEGAQHMFPCRTQLSDITASSGNCMVGRPSDMGAPRSAGCGTTMREVLEGRMTESATEDLEALDCMITKTLMEACGLIDRPHPAPKDTISFLSLMPCVFRRAPSVIGALAPGQGPSHVSAETTPIENGQADQLFSDAMSVRAAQRSFCPLDEARVSASDMDALRAAHDNMLVANFVSWTEEDNVVQRPQPQPTMPSRQASFSWVPSIVLAAFGIIPFKRGRTSLLYSCAVFASMAAVLLHSVVLVALDPRLYNFHGSTVCVALGASLGLVFLWVRRIQDFLGPRDGPLLVHAKACGFIGIWSARSLRRLVVVTALWTMAVVCRTTASFTLNCPETAASRMSLLSFSLAHALMASLVYCQLHICCGFELAIDNFCRRFFRSGDFSKAISEWNVLQAMLRRSASDIEACFLALGTSVLGVLMLTALRVWNAGDMSSLPHKLGLRCEALWAGWVLPPAALIFLAIAQGAAVTEKCSRVPSLLNTWVLDNEEQIDHKRQYLVQYIVHSAAGFYVKGVRLRATWALKVAYLSAAILFSVISQSLIGYKDIFGNPI